MASKVTGSGVDGKPWTYTITFIDPVGSLPLIESDNGIIRRIVQWLLDSSVIEKIDSTVDFDWGSGSITTYGRDYASIRWWGKLKASKLNYTPFICMLMMEHRPQNGN